MTNTQQHVTLSRAQAFALTELDQRERGFVSASFFSYSHPDGERWFAPAYKGGVSESTMRALERRGLVEGTRVNDSYNRWRMTDNGRQWVNT